MTRLKLGVLTDEKYQTILACAKNVFAIPRNKRSIEQRQGAKLYSKWRSLLNFKDDKLLFNGKLLITQSEVSRVVKQCYSENLGIGTRALYYKLRERYHGISERCIQNALNKSRRYHKERPQFLNKPVPSSINAKFSGERWQMDLIQMRNESVVKDGKVYKYILQVIDVFSRFIMTRPLTDKSSATVARALEEVIHEHDAPRVIQCDNGSEFKGGVEKLCRKFGIKIIHSSPYHPQSQGKCERSNKTLKTKIQHATSRRRGFNWASGLQKITFIINKIPKAILGYRTPMEVYYARGNSKKTKKALKVLGEKYQRKIAFKLGGKISSYKLGEKVLIRYPFLKGRIPKKRYIIEGTVLRKGRYGNKYKVKYVNTDGEELVGWVGIQHITSITVEKEKKRRKHHVNKKVFTTDKAKPRKKSHREHFYLVLNHEDKLQTLNVDGLEKVNVIHDPRPDGGCQFDAIANQFAQQGIYTSAENLRRVAVEHIRSHKTSYMHFVYEDFDDYIQQMQLNGTYGDHLTLLAIMREYNSQCIVISTSGLDHTTFVSNDGLFHRDMRTIVLGHFPEHSGIHYVSVELSFSDLQTCVRAVCDVADESDKQSPHSVTHPQSPNSVTHPQSPNSVTHPQSPNSDTQPQSPKSVTHPQSPHSDTQPQSPHSVTHPQSLYACFIVELSRFCRSNN